MKTEMRAIKAALHAHSKPRCAQSKPRCARQSKPRCARNQRARFARQLIMYAHIFSRFARNQYFSRYARLIKPALRAVIKG